MAAASPPKPREIAETPGALRALVERYDPDVADVGERRARIRLEVAGEGAWDVVVRDHRARFENAAGDPDAILTADAATWRTIHDDVRGGMRAFEANRLAVRRDLHLGVGFLAATSGLPEDRRLELRTIRTRKGRISTAQGGAGPPVVCLHGLGATKASFLPTIADLAEQFRVIAIDLPGFGDSSKPLSGAYDAPFFADAVVDVLDALGLDRAHLVGNSMGGRVALEVGLRTPERVECMGLLAPSLAWRRGREWAPLLRLVPPKLGVIQPAPRAVVEAIVQRVIPGAREGWTAAGAPPSTPPRATSTSRSPTARTGSGPACAACRCPRSSSGAARTTSCRSGSPGTSPRRSRTRSTSSSTAGTSRSSSDPARPTRP